MALYFVFAFLAIFIQINGAITHDVKPKEYTINLDLPAEERWLEMLKSRPFVRDEVNKVIKLVLGRVPAMFRTPLMDVMAELVNYLPEPYASEMKGIAKLLNISIAEVVLPNVLYDYTAFCTSIVAQDKKGQIWHGRNLDYDFSNYLRNSTIVAHFQQKGKIVYTVTTYTGIVGVLTGQKHGVFTISMDERNQGPIWMNFLTSIFDKNAKHAVFLIRDLLETAKSYDDMVETLQDTDTIAPAYYIVGGTQPGEGAVITRDRLRARDTWTLDPTHGRWFLVETNYDHWKAPPKSDDRRHPAIKYMTAAGQANVNTTSIYKVLSTPPLLRPTTTYTTVMSASHPQLYTTVVRYYKP